MNIGGVSIKGRTHEKNQDSFICETLDDSYLVAVADGLGSRIFSEIGANSLTRAARAVFIGRRGSVEDTDDLNLFVEEIHSRWLTSLAVRNFPIEECLCTCLLLIVQPKKILAAALGDGLIGVLADEKFSCLTDYKENRFVNETACLTEKFLIDDWQFLELAYESFAGAIVCTDGVSFGENKSAKFVADFCRENLNRPRREILDDLTRLLENWNSNDDKTLAFVLSLARRRD